MSITTSKQEIGDWIN